MQNNLHCFTLSSSKQQQEVQQLLEYSVNNNNKSDMNLIERQKRWLFPIPLAPIAPVAAPAAPAASGTFKLKLFFVKNLF